MQFVQYDLLYRRLTENYRERVCGGVDETVSGVGRRYKMTFKVLQLIVDGDFLTEKDLQKISNSNMTTFHHNSNFLK